MDFSQKLKKHLFSIINQMSQNTEQFVSSPQIDFSRNRKLSFETMIKLILSMEAGSIHRELLKYFKFSSDTASASAFIQQRKKLSISAFEYLFHSFNTFLKGNTFKGYNVVACDGSVITMPLDDKPQNEKYKYIRARKDQKDYYQLHTTMLYDIINERYLDAYVEPRKGHDERGALSSMIENNYFPKKTIFIGDRGFEGYSIMAQIMQKGMFFVIRVKDGKNGGLLKGFPLPKDGEYDKILSYTYTNKRNSYVWQHPEIFKVVHYKSSPYFLNSDRHFFDMTLRFVRIKLKSGCYECLVTNLPKEVFSVNELKSLYGMRWGIETSFRTLKYNTGLLQFHSKKAEFNIQDLWAHMIMYNFYSAITKQIKPVKKRYKYKPNFTDAVHICRYFLKVCNDETPLDIETLLLKGMLPIRPERQFPRKKRNNPPIGFQYRLN